MTEHLSPGEARRIALAAQGFGARRPAKAGMRQLLGAAERLNLFQIDSVNVLVRAHYLPAFSRLGGYDRGLIDRAAWGRRRERRLFEYWAHEASLLPVGLQPLLRWRMAQAERGETGWGRLRRFATELRHEADAVLARIESEGPLSAADFEGGRSTSGWWEWSHTKHALEYLFWAGRVTTRTRVNGFRRVYDLTERVLPPAVLAQPTPPEAEAQRALIERAARALGIATAADLRDYFRMRPAEAAGAIAALVEAGVLIPAAVAGLRGPWYRHRDARAPRRIAGEALLAPFDPLIWERTRTERLFGFRYRIGIYTPAARREHGYYVLPFLVDGALAARVDLKADRARSALRVQQAVFEPHAPVGTRERLAGELERMAQWLGLERVEAL